MAKAIATKLLETRKLKRPVTIEAAAMGPVTMPTISYAARYAINEMYGEDLLENHRPQTATAQMLERADLILVMERSLMYEKVLPSGKTFLLKEFLGVGGDIVDPWPDGKDPNTLARYRACAEELRQVLADNVDQLVRVLNV